MAWHGAMRRSVQGVADAARGTTPAHDDLRARLLGIALLSLVLDIAAGIGAYFLERGEPHEFRSMWGALFWTTTQLLTVSSQLPNPDSVGAHVLDVGLELWAITAVTALAGSFGAFFHHRSRVREGAQEV
jgi:hypothetical protein